MMNFLQFKVVLLGETSVGKSSLSLRFVKDYFNEVQEITIGAAFLSKIVIIEDVKIKLEIWDTAGQERYRSLAPMYYRGAHGALVMYDITNLESFHRAKLWIQELKERAATVAVIALVGNKIDLSHGREVNETEAKLYAEEQNLIFMETSSKTNLNVQEVFTELSCELSKLNLNNNPSDSLRPNLNQNIKPKCFCNDL